MVFGLNPGVELALPQYLFSNQRERGVRKNARILGDTCAETLGAGVNKQPLEVGAEKQWLPGMDSNHELDKFLKSRNLLILKSR